MIKMKRRKRGKPSTLTRVHGITVEAHDWDAWCELAAKQNLSTAEWLRQAGREAAARGGVIPERPRPPPAHVVPPVLIARRGHIAPVEVSKWLAVNIRREKRKRLLIDVDLAKRTGLTRETITRLQSGKWQQQRHNQQNRTLALLVSLANALGITPAELLTQPQDMSLLFEKGVGALAYRERQEAREKRLAALSAPKRALAELEESLGFQFDD
jgi:transcriptional regulator with XRE-family HTH domain